MSNLLADGAAWQAGKLKSHAAETVTISDGTYTAEISATTAREDAPLDEMNGQIITYQMRDFIVTAADLVLNSQTVTPRPGWTITRTNGRIYEVQHPPGTDQCFREVPGGVMLRIHTTRKS